MLQPQKVLHLSKALALKTPKLDGMFLLTEKFDGWYVQIEYRKLEDRWYSPVSSRLRGIPSIAWSVELFDKLPKPHYDCIIIAEVVIPDVSFHITNGILNRTVGNFVCKDIVFKIHDVIFPKLCTSAGTRWRYLQELDVSNAANYLHKVELLATGFYERVLWDKLFNEVIDSGGEGIVAKRADAYYSPGKRNSDLLKLKLECTVDCIADRVETTIGDKGNLGVTLISKRKNGVEIRTVINSLVLQDTLLHNPNTVIGKVVELHAMNELEDGQLRQPTFYCIREDKSIDEID
jgi:hypothetical protein